MSQLDHQKRIAESLRELADMLESNEVRALRMESSVGPDPFGECHFSITYCNLEIAK